ncbi:ABC transporter ATP-binding protein [Lachnospiraceae bacterium ZAX-1]
MAELAHSSGVALPDHEVLHVEDLTIWFGGLLALDGLTFSVYDKEIFGLIGPNGAGKTTAFNCITQFYKPTKGKVLFRSKTGKNSILDLCGCPVHSIIRYGLVRTFQNVEVIKELSLIDNVLIGAHIDFKSNPLSQALKLPSARREEALYRQKAFDTLKFLGIDDRANLLAAGQPYGVLKKVELARTLLCDPKLIILDEPAAGLNDVETQELAEVIKKIRDTYHCAILLVEHDMRLVMTICDRICAISFGKFLACDTPEGIQKNQLVQEAYLGKGDDE